MKKEFSALLIITIVVASTFLAVKTYAQPSPIVNIYSWTDKPSYSLGQSGVLTIVIRNDRTDEDLIMENITIQYPWFAYVGDKWDGNDTIKPSPPFVLSKLAGNVYKTTVGFTVPTDGRVTSGTFSPSQITLVVTVDKSPYEYTSTPSISVLAAPSYVSFQDMDKLLMLFTVLVVLVIVCTVIIAATVFLSRRRPRNISTQGTA